MATYGRRSELTIRLSTACLIRQLHLAWHVDSAGARHAVLVDHPWRTLHAAARFGLRAAGWACALLLTTRGAGFGLRRHLGLHLHLLLVGLDMDAEGAVGVALLHGLHVVLQMLGVVVAGVDLEIGRAHV